MPKTRSLGLVSEETSVNLLYASPAFRLESPIGTPNKANSKINLPYTYIDYPFPGGEKAPLQIDTLSPH